MAAFYTLYIREGIFADPSATLLIITVIARSVSDEAIQTFSLGPGLLRFARNDDAGA